MKRWRFAHLLSAAVVGAIVPAYASAAGPSTELVDQTPHGTYAHGGTSSTGLAARAVSVSADGRYVAFISFAPDLVAGDTNEYDDVFVRDRQTGQTVRASVNSQGTQANFDSDSVALSADGRFVAFRSSASNLVPDDTNGLPDIFVHDLATGGTTRVSVGSTGEQADQASFLTGQDISSDGRYVLFESDADNLVEGDSADPVGIFLHDLQTGSTTQVDLSSTGLPSGAYTYTSAISADGKVVAFDSTATKLVPHDTNGYQDIFVRNLVTGVTARASVTSKGHEANDFSFEPSLSADGHLVAFASRSPLGAGGHTRHSIQVYVHNLNTGVTSRVSKTSAGQTLIGSRPRDGIDRTGFPSISADGSKVAFTSGPYLPYLRNRQTKQTALVAPSVDGGPADGYTDAVSLSADGSAVAFHSDASNLVDPDGYGGWPGWSHFFVSAPFD